MTSVFHKCDAMVLAGKGDHRATSSESDESETLPQKRGSECPRVDGKREKSARRLCTSISEYWNNSDAALPTFCTWPPLRTRRYSDDCQENTTFFTVPGLLYPLPRTETVERATMCGKLWLRATVRNSSPFVEYQAGANRCLQLRSVPRFHAIRGYLFFHYPALFVFIRDGMKSGCNLSIRNSESRRTGCV